MQWRHAVQEHITRDRVVQYVSLTKWKWRVFSNSKHARQVIGADLWSLVGFAEYGPDIHIRQIASNPFTTSSIRFCKLAAFTCSEQLAG